MKKVFLICSLFAFSLISNAQEESSSLKSSFAVTAAPTFGKLTNAGKMFGLDSDDMEMNGVNFGVAFDVPIVKWMSYKTEVLFNYSGVTMDDTYTKTDVSKFDFQVPFYISFRIPCGDRVAIRFNLGSFNSIGLGGKVKTDVSVLGKKVSVEDKFYGKDSFYRFNTAGVFGAGVDIKKFYVGVNYNFGVTNLNRDTHGEQIKFNQTYIRLAYTLTK